MLASAAALADLVEWSADLPEWQRDALRRLMTVGSLTPDCLDQLTAICCGHPTAPLPQPVDATHVTSGNRERRVVALKSVRNATGVNALASGQTLAFAERGLTVVYGENGAGKSGYARILKAACRARGAVEVLGNVYTQPAATLPSAEIEFIADGANRVASWQSDAPCEPELAFVSIFDSNVAAVRVDHANEIAYTPISLRVLSDLASACTGLETKLKQDRTHIEARQPGWVSKPACADGTRAMAALRSIGADTDADALVTALALSEQEEAERRALAADLQQDAAALTKDLSSRIAWLDRVLTVLSEAVEAVSSGRTDAVKEVRAAAAAARTAADAASSALFGTAAISGIGGEAWRVLWDAARRFSEGAAYRDRAFPVVDDGSLCVLCVQPLTKPASARLASFEEFVRTDTQRAADHAQANLGKLLIEWAALWPKARSIPAIVRFLSRECGDPDLAYAVRTFLLDVRLRLRRGMRHEAPAGVSTVANPTHLVSAMRNRMAAELRALQSGETRALRATKSSQHAELDGRAWLSAMREEIQAEVARCRELRAIDGALKLTATRRISTKAKELSKALVTDALRDAFAREVNALGIPHLRIEMSEDGARRGAAQFRIRLLSGRPAPLGKVLSEGEFRTVALAAFLAELATAEDLCGIVFDDPVSSLDHHHRHAVAKRLVREAHKRQVIVFTHDLFFLFALRAAAQEEELDAVRYQHVRRSSTGDLSPGMMHSKLPWEGQDARAAGKTLKSRLAQASALLDDPERWEEQTKSLCTALRQAWERALEDYIGAVLYRFSPDVQFKRMPAIAVLTEKDVAVAQASFDWCSKYLHLGTLAQPRSTPLPEDFEQQIGYLLNWIEEVEKKQKLAKIRK
jgi:energy-coupling factor transporter ATP-binding protein EcfA2